MKSASQAAFSAPVGSAVQSGTRHPDLLDGAADDLELPRDGQTERVEIPPESFEQQRGVLGIVCEQTRAAAAAGELVGQHGTVEQVVAVDGLRQRDLHHNGRPVRGDRLGDVRGGAARERHADHEVPAALEVVDHGREVPQPPLADRAGRTALRRTASGRSNGPGVTMRDSTEVGYPGAASSLVSAAASTSSRRTSPGTMRRSAVPPTTGTRTWRSPAMWRRAPRRRRSR